MPLLLLDFVCFDRLVPDPSSLNQTPTSWSTLFYVGVVFFLPDVHLEKSLAFVWPQALPAPV